MIDLATEYLGLRLRSPLVCSSSPLTETPVNVRRMEDAGAGAIVLHSLFEEQIELESLGLDDLLTCTADGFAEALSYFPDMTAYNTGPDGYLDHLRRSIQGPGPDSRPFFPASVGPPIEDVLCRHGLCNSSQQIRGVEER